MFEKHRSTMQTALLDAVADRMKVFSWKCIEFSRSVNIEINNLFFYKNWKWSVILFEDRPQLPEEQLSLKPISDAIMTLKFDLNLAG